MKKSFLREFYPHLTALVIFIIISCAYFPPFFQGKQIKPHDVMTFQGMSQEYFEHREKGEYILWTNRMFSGMPIYLIINPSWPNQLRHIHMFFDFRGKLRPISYVFMCLIICYFSLLLFRVNPWLGMAGAIAYAFSSYYFIIIDAGHVTKTLALAYMPGVIASIYIAYNKKLLLGSVLLSIFLGLQILVNHLQITYYTLLIVLIFGIYYGYHAWKEKTLDRFLKTTLILFIPVAFAVGSNITTMWTTMEYGQYSMRGPSELTHNIDQQTRGLDKDYATQWSYGIDETLTLLIPNFKGGSSAGELSTDSETYKVLRNGNVPNARSLIKQMPLYFGTQPMTSGPVYVGAVIFFFFVLGLFLVKGPVKWWILTATILSIMLAWGKNFMFLTDLFLDYFPGYNKFRTVSMTLVIAQFTIPLLAILTLKNIFENKYTKDLLLKGLKYTLYLVGGICLLVTLFPGIAGDFVSQTDARMGWPEVLLEALRQDRRDMVQSDAIRSLVFVLLAASLVFMYFHKKLNLKASLVILIALILFDMWPVNKRYLNNDDFVPKRQAEVAYSPTNADKAILEDSDDYYRVLNISVSPFQDGSTSYFHNSIGGYHGAKMQRYQDLYDFHITRNIGDFARVLQQNPNNLFIDSALRSQHVLNMLNTRYIIYNPEAPPIFNSNALGNVWFVNDFRLVENADEEIQALYNFDATREAIIDNRFADILEEFVPVVDTQAYIELANYHPDRMTYEVSTQTPQLAVFSEIYYPAGWNAYVNGEITPHFRANYVLRAMIVPPGENTIEFRFEPKSYAVGSKISFASSLLLILLLVAIIGYEITRYAKQRETEKMEL